MISPQIRMTRRLYDTMQSDLRRPHPFAAERVGFVFGRIANAATSWPLIFLTHYREIEDRRYMHDTTVGARIDGVAIQDAMQSVLDGNEGAFHVHLHEWPGRPQFSTTDATELPAIVRSLRTVGPRQAHGLLLLSDDSAYADVWMPSQKNPVSSRINVVGFPMKIIEA